jgi:hypothetical protein
MVLSSFFGQLNIEDTFFVQSFCRFKSCLTSPFGSDTFGVETLTSLSSFDFGNSKTGRLKSSLISGLSESGVSNLL